MGCTFLNPDPPRGLSSFAFLFSSLSLVALTLSFDMLLKHRFCVKVNRPGPLDPGRSIIAVVPH
jgi:hypothetical protein